MDALIRVTVDDALLAAYIDDLYRDGMGTRGDPEEPAEFLARRLRELCDDELPVALWGWTSNLDLRLAVEVPA